MATVTFDTHKFVKKLESAGINQAQAEAFVEAQRDSLAEALDTTLATKADIARIEKELAVLKWMMGLVVGGISALIIKAFIG